MEKEFEGKTALVTGGSRGIGRAVCLDLAQSGAKVAVNFTLNASAAEKTVEMIRNQGGEAFAVRADVSRPAEVQSMVSQVEETHGPVDLLVTKPRNSATTQCSSSPSVSSCGPSQLSPILSWHHALPASLKPIPTK